MTKRIDSYEDLLKEQARLQALLQAQKELVRADIDQIRAEFITPVRSAISYVGKFATKEKGNWMLTTAADTIIDIVFKRMVLAKAGWVTKLVVPFFMKNFSSHVIADNKDKIVNKLFAWFGKKQENGKMPDSKVEKENLYEEEED